jgi:hypothetical protein
MAFALFYAGADSQEIAASYQAARNNLSVADRFNIDAVWNGGLNTWNSAANLVYTVATDTWSDYCRNPYPSGPVDFSLCDKDTHLITISGNWARNAAAYGAVQGQPITKAGFVGLMHRLADADPLLSRRAFMHVLAEDIANTAREPMP